MTTDKRPPVAIGHVFLDVADVGPSSDFYVTLGMRPIVVRAEFAVLELRGGTHAVLQKAEAVDAGEAAPFDLMVDDIDGSHSAWSDLGFEPSEISRGNIHDSFTLTDPSGYLVTINSTHVGDAAELRASVQEKYREVAETPDATFHFHTGRPLAARLGYDAAIVDALPDAAVESFAGVANPWERGGLTAGEKVVDVGSGAGFDCFVAAAMVGENGHVVGIDMTLEMLKKSRETADQLGSTNVEFREGLVEDLPVDDGWADVVISNGVINLVADKRLALREIWRVLRPGGRFQFADIANGRPVPEEALRDIDLWTA